MSETAGSSSHELPNLVTVLAERLHGSAAAKYLIAWENVIFSLIIIVFLSIAAYLASRRVSVAAPGRAQSFFEMVVGGIDDFVVNVMGPGGKEFVPFIGTIFVYILCMNLSGLIPFIKSPSTSWSTTIALAICVTIYTIYFGFRQMGLIGFIDYMMGRPRGIVAFSVFIPIMMFMLEVVSLVVRPVSLSLRLRSNIWGDDMLLAVFAGFGLQGIPLLLFNSFMAIIVSLVQALVFALLSTIYFTLILSHGQEH